jgi:hypothetical protein
MMICRRYHFTVAGVGFLCRIAPCFMFAARLARDGTRDWAWFSRLPESLFALSFFALSSRAGAAAILA